MQLIPHSTTDQLRIRAADVCAERLLLFAVACKRAASGLTSLTQAKHDNRLGKPLGVLDRHFHVLLLEIRSEL